MERFLWDTLFDGRQCIGFWCCISQESLDRCGEISYILTVLIVLVQMESGIYKTERIYLEKFYKNGQQFIKF